MSKTRKTLIVIFLVLGTVLVTVSFYIKAQQEKNGICCVLAFSGFILATIALVLIMSKPKLK